MRTRLCLLRTLPPCCLLLMLAGCQYFDPYERPGAWNFKGSNAANLATMVANPLDLAHGQSSPGADGNAAATAIANLRQGQARALTQGSSINSLAAPSATPAAAQVTN